MDLLLDGVSLVFDFADTWDFDGNGAAEPADVRLEMVRAGRDPVCPPIPPAVLGSWTATSMVVSGPVSTHPTRDLVDAGSMFVMTLCADGRFDFSLARSGADFPETVSGRWRFTPAG